MAPLYSFAKRYAIALFLAVVVLGGLVAFGDFREVSAALRRLRLTWVPFIFFLALCNYFVRFLRWHWYLRLVNVRLPIQKSWVVFFSGLALSVTPGKFGEMVKSFFVKKMTGTPASTTLPVVFAERLTDLAAVLVLSAIGALSFQYGGRVVWIGIAVVMILFAAVTNHRLANYCLGLLGRLPALRNASENIAKIYAGAAQLLAFKPFVAALLLGIVAWLFECVAFFLTLYALGQPLGLQAATFIYAFSTLFGAVTLLPGGLGTTEGSMVGLLLLRGLPKELASAATIVIRTATLWFAVALGLLFFLPHRRRLTETSYES